MTWLIATIAISLILYCYGYCAGVMDGKGGVWGYPRPPTEPPLRMSLRRVISKEGSEL